MFPFHTRFLYFSYVTAAIIYFNRIRPVFYFCFLIHLFYFLSVLFLFLSRSENVLCSLARRPLADLQRQRLREVPPDGEREQGAHEAVTEAQDLLHSRHRHVCQRDGLQHPGGASQPHLSGHSKFMWLACYISISEQHQNQNKKKSPSSLS